MNKQDMREWVASLEEMIDNKLKKWEKHKKWENGKEPIHLMWQWEQTLIKLDIFWKIENETIRFKIIGPNKNYDDMLFGLTDKTFNYIQDRIGNLAMNIMYPPIDPKDVG